MHDEQHHQGDRTSRPILGGHHPSPRGGPDVGRHRRAHWHRESGPGPVGGGTLSVQSVANPATGTGNQKRKGGATSIHKVNTKPVIVGHEPGYGWQEAF